MVFKRKNVRARPVRRYNRRASVRKPVYRPIMRVRAANSRFGGLMHKELKFADYSRYGISVAQTMELSLVDPETVDCLNGIAQGDGSQNRDGRSVMVKSIQISMHFANVDHVAATSVVSRIATIFLVQDTQTNAAQMGPGTMFVHAASAQLCRINPEWSRRFKVLYKKRLIFPISIGNDSATTMVAHYGAKMVDVYKKLNMPVTFTGAGGTVANINDNSLHLLVIGDNANILLEYTARIRYVEM